MLTQIVAVLALQAARPVFPPPTDPPIRTSPLIIGPPSEAMLGYFYPPGGPYPRQAGHASARCKAKADGTLADCVLEAESPAGSGFGEALLRMARFTPVSPASVDGVPFDEFVRFEVDWPGAK